MPCTPSVRPVILNNSPLAALWSINRISLLRDLYTEVLIPQAVCDEFLAKHDKARQATLKNTPWIKVTPLANPRQALVYTGLDKGGAEILALALEKSASLVVIDEYKGRRYANRIGVPLTGTLGILLAAKSRGLIPAIALLVNQLLAAGLFLSSAIVENVLKIAGEK